MYGHFHGGNFRSVFSHAVAERLGGGERGLDAGGVILAFRVRVDMGVMTMKGYATLPDLQNWSLSIRCSLMPYSGHSFWRRGFTPPPGGSNQRILSPIDKMWTTLSYKVIIYRTYKKEKWIHFIQNIFSGIFSNVILISWFWNLTKRMWLVIYLLAFLNESSRFPSKNRRLYYPMRI